MSTTTSTPKPLTTSSALTSTVPSVPTSALDTLSRLEAPTLIDIDEGVGLREPVSSVMKRAGGEVGFTEGGIPRTRRDETETETKTEAEVEGEGGLEFLDPSHPLLKRIQDAIHVQLSTKKEKVVSDLRENQIRLTQATQKREEVGVSLYQAQQSLARLQALLEGAHDRLMSEKNSREDSERKLRVSTTTHQEELKKLKDRTKNFEHQKNELDRINASLRQCEVYHSDLTSQLSVAKRTTLKAEEDMTKAEHDKKLQDLFIDRLQSQIRRLQDQLAMYEYQLLSQQNETQAAHETLQEAALEMEAITFEKKQLLQQWKSSLIALEKRDEMLRRVEDAIEKEKESSRTLAVELTGYKTSLRKAQEKNESLTAVLSKLEHEMEFLQKQLQNISDNKDRLKESYAMYTKSLHQTESDLEAANKERTALQNLLNQTQKQLTSTTQKIQETELQILSEMQDQAGVEKQKSGAKKAGLKMKQELYEKESNIAATENQIASIKMESISLQARIKELKEQQEACNKKVQEKNELIERYETEIRRRNDSLKKKQSEMEVLNRKLEQIIAHYAASGENESIGPLEATIHNLGRTLSEKEKEVLQLQQYWLKSQTDMVQQTKEIDELHAKIDEAKSKKTILERKKARIDAQFQREEQEIKELRRNVRKIQNDMVKINTLLTKHSKVQEKLEQNNLGLETGFRAKLHDAEMESLRLEEQIEKLKEEKEVSLAGLVDAERQIMVWEKKIQLARETQAALDPNVGAVELKEMEQEIHRMKLRQAQLAKLQEKYIKDMEKSVYRHGEISDRATNMRKLNFTTGVNAQQQQVQKSIADLTKRIKQTLNDLKECDRDITHMIASQRALIQQVQETEDACMQLDQKQISILQEFNGKLDRRVGNLTNISTFQSRVRRYEDLRSGKYVFACKDGDKRPQELEKQRLRCKKYIEIVQSLESQFADRIQPFLLETGLRGIVRSVDV